MKKKTIILVRLLVAEDGGIMLVRMVSNCSPVYTFCLDKLVVAQLDKKFSVFYVTRSVIIAVFRSPLPSTYPETFVALYSLLPNTAF
jgi:hypothetical protein